MKLILPLSFFSLMNYNFMYKIILSSMILIMLLKYNNLMIIVFNKFMFLDSLSLIMIMLSIISTILIILSSNSLNYSFIFISMIMLTLMMTFSAMNMMYFYMMFEIVLIPTFFLITMIGYQPERLLAGMYLLIYTILASLPLLIGIMTLKNNLNLIFLMNSCKQLKFIIIFMLAFLIKLPMFMFHLWLPKAHVEAPIEGSMILAAVLLKLGGYGLIRFAPMMLMKMNSMNFWLISISLLGAMFTSMNCIRQKDLKSLIAYSSVSHMGLALSSLLTINHIGISGTITMMIAHGLSSSALFLLVNILYSINHSRNMISFKGLLNIFPNLTFWWFIFIIINMSAPPSINLASEILILMTLMNYNYMILFPAILISLTTSVFSILLFMNSIHNSPTTKLSSQPPTKMFLSLAIHLIPLILLIMKLDFML